MSLDHTANSVDMSKFKSKIFAHMEIADELVKMQVDSGASCNVLPKKFLPKDSKIQKTDLKLTTYSKTPSPDKGGGLGVRSATSPRKKDPATETNTREPRNSVLRRQEGGPTGSRMIKPLA